MGQDSSPIRPIWDIHVNPLRTQSSRSCREQSSPVGQYLRGDPCQMAKFIRGLVNNWRMRSWYGYMNWYNSYQDKGLFFYTPNNNYLPYPSATGWVISTMTTCGPEGSLVRCRFLPSWTRQCCTPILVHRNPNHPSPFYTYRQHLWKALFRRLSLVLSIRCVISSAPSPSPPLWW